MYALVVAEMAMAYTGLCAITPRPWRQFILPVVTSAFIAIDFYGVHMLLVPYYTGLISHVASTDIVRPATLHQIVDSVGLMLDRLGTNKARFLRSGAYAVGFVLYYIATLTCFVIGWRCRHAEPTRIPRPDLSDFSETRQQQDALYRAHTSQLRLMALAASTR